MTPLSDTQRILLSTASTRESGSVLPLLITLKPGGGVSKAVAALINHGLAEERPTDDAAIVRRTDDDGRYGVFITAMGLAAIGIEPGADEDGGDSAGIDAPAVVAARPTKITIVLDLLRRPDGASMAELIEATGWLPHTTRAAMTGLRKKGHDVERFKRDGATCYRLAVAG